VPGIIGTLGATMGDHGVNIANFTLGRKETGGDAIALLYVDNAIPQSVLEALKLADMFETVHPLEFDA
jgi:D-3-phosphoglycerate dehydrogenase